ncbi:MAG: tagaturonate epimerase family protein [Bryobacteraceae bacterium]
MSKAVLSQDALATAARTITGGSPVSIPSLTVCGRTAFGAITVDGADVLVQVGGEPGAHGLQAPLQSGEADGAPVHVYAFASTDRDNIRAFAENIDRAFLPRPQGAQPAIAAGNRHPEISLPAVFQAFREVLRETGVNLASTVQLSATREMTLDAMIAARDGSNPTAPGHTRVSILHLYHAGLWAAIRAGFREGYNAEADHFIVSGASDAEIAKSLEWVKESIHDAAGYTKFTTDTSRLFDLRADTRHTNPYSEAEIGEMFLKILGPEQAAWTLRAFEDPFVCGDHSYNFSEPEIKRLAVKFCPSLLLNEDLYDTIVKVKGGAPFDFEPSLDEAETLTTTKELIFYMHWLKERGRPAQLVPPNLGFKKRQAYPDTYEALEKYAWHKMWPELLPRVKGEFDGQPLAELRERVRELAAVSTYFDGTLSIHSGSGKQAEVLNHIGAATAGRVNYKISGELQLQLFDVLSEQPADSPERQLFDRMVTACEEFAAKGAFGEESELAAKYRASGHGSYLGNASKGRVDGNLFLVFWLGNMVGCKDTDGVFFKDKLDRLPVAIHEESRRRNVAYIKWLAANLIGQ